VSTHTHRRIALMVFVLLLMLVALPLRVEAQDTNVFATVTAANVNLRSGPGLDYNEVGAAKANDRFPVIGRAHGSNRVWYKIVLRSGATAWISERVVKISPSPDSVPWLSDNSAKVPLVMDCGANPPVLIVGSHAQVTRPGGLELHDSAGVGKNQVGVVPNKAVVQVIDGPFCTRLAKDFFRIEWIVLTDANKQGYMMEGQSDGKGGYSAYATLSVNTGAATGADTGRPEKLTDSDIQAVTAIFQAVQKKESDLQTTTKALTDEVENTGTDGLAWIVRHVPIYDGKTEHWQSFARYEDLSVMPFDLNSDLDKDPVSIATNILFGNYQTNEELLGSMGCGGG
jgi:SH3-like domain-containing protein